MLQSRQLPDSLPMLQTELRWGCGFRYSHDQRLKNARHEGSYPAFVGCVVDVYLTREEYALVRVSTLIRSPCSMNNGT